ncbi:MAG TPA: hypothetical protein VJ992_16060 [Gemmatimonadales bacterium]|nr:hypothetical protein [Gemmatimonadales bacterium]
MPLRLVRCNYTLTQDAAGARGGRDAHVVIVRHDAWYVPALVVWTLCVLAAAWLIAARGARDRWDTDDTSG